MRVPTGIEGLDKLIGGLKPGSFCLINAPALSGKEELLQELFYQGLTNGEGCIYVSTQDFADEIIGKLTERKGSLIGEYKFIDAYKQVAEPQVKNSKRITYVSSAVDFANLGHILITQLSDFTKRELYQLRISFSSIDTLLMSVNYKSVYRFLAYLRAKLRLFKALGFFGVEEDLHEEKEIRAILQLADVLLRLKEGKIELATGTSMYRGRYKVSDKGFEILP